MRIVLRITVPIEKDNETFKNGSLGKTMESVMKKLEPDIFDLVDPSDIVEIAEPLFLNLNAAVEFVPVMNADDLRKGLMAASKGKG